MADGRQFGKSKIVIQGRSQDFILTEAKGYTGGLRAEPPAGSRGRAPGRGVRGRSPRGRSPLKLKADPDPPTRAPGRGVRGEAP